MVEYYFWGQISEIKLCCRVGTLWHLENRALISKREKVIANKRTFFWILWVNILLEIWNPFLHLLDQTWHNCAWPQQKTFPSLRNAKKWGIIWHHKNLLLQVISWAGSVGSSENLVLRSLTHVVMYLGGSRFLNDFLLYTRRSRNQRRAKNALKAKSLKKSH